MEERATKEKPRRFIILQSTRPQFQIGIPTLAHFESMVAGDRFQRLIKKGADQR